MTREISADIAIVGTGIIGIAAAYYLVRNHGLTNIALIDQGQPMAFTSAQSGENYRNWWPHPLMAAFANRSIDLMEELARESGNRIAMTRRGYILATRSSDIDPLLQQLSFSLGGRTGEAELRIHRDPSSATYKRALSADWQAAPAGFDVLQNDDLIRASFPSLDPAVRSILHIRRAGDISGQQLGQLKLERMREKGVRRIAGMVEDIRQGDGFDLALRTPDGPSRLKASRIINAAGPFAGQIARMLGVELPLFNVLQQKIAFPDTERAIPRGLPFAIDLDGQHIDWSEDERASLLEDTATARFAAAMPGAIHCRPDGGDRGTWIKLGWAYNSKAQEASWDIPTDPHFPEIVLRGAARLNPALKAYYGRLPREMRHYGGWYTRTEDNWPLIGPMGPEGAFMACALSGHGTMTACAVGELTAQWLTGAERPACARPFSLERFRDPSLAPPAESAHGLL